MERKTGIIPKREPIKDCSLIGFCCESMFTHTQFLSLSLRHAYKQTLTHSLTHSLTNTLSLSLSDTNTHFLSLSDKHSVFSRHWATRVILAIRCIL